MKESTNDKDRIAALLKAALDSEDTGTYARELIEEALALVINNQ